MYRLMQNLHSIKDVLSLHKDYLWWLNNMIRNRIKFNGGHFRENLETYI
jgi:hypothetical protein